MEVNEMSHSQCYVELQDVWIPEEECNSVDFEVIYGRMSLEEIRAQLVKRRTAN